MVIHSLQFQEKNFPLSFLTTIGTKYSRSKIFLYLETLFCETKNHAVTKKHIIESTFSRFVKVWMDDTV